MHKKILNYYHSIADGPKKVLHNMNWLFWDNVVRMGIMFFIGVWIARYLGPEKYGIFNYSMAFVTVFSFISTLGLDIVVVKELVNHPEDKHKILGSAFILKLFGGLLAFLIINIISFFINSDDYLKLILILIFSSGFIFHPINCIGFYFQSTVDSKYNVFVTFIAFAISNLLKVYILISGLGLIYLATVGLIEVLITALAYIYSYKKISGFWVLHWRFSKDVAIGLLKKGLPIALASIGYLIYARIDQVMIGSMIGSKEVGLYSISVTLSEIPIIIASILGSSLFPAIIASKNISTQLYETRLKLYYSLMSLISVSATLFIFLFAQYIILTFFGKAYIGSIIVLQICVFYLIIIYFLTVFTYHLINEKLQNYLLYSSLLGALLNIIFNLILIPKYGIVGAAISTVIPMYLSSLVFLFIKDTRQLFLFSIKAYNPIYIFTYAINKSFGHKK